METDVDVAALHGYLSSDGYVIKSAPDSKSRYHFVGFRNTEPELLLDFQEHFERVFDDSPHISKDWDRCVKGNKEYYEFFTTKFGSFYSREWRMPEMTDVCCAVWLRAFFDCEGWVVCVKAKNRAIGLESINSKGLRQVKTALEGRFQIMTSEIKRKKNREIYSFHIWGKPNLIAFRERVGFLHPKKKRKLDEAIASYDTWRWNLPENEQKLRAFLRDLLKHKLRFRRHAARLFSREEDLNKVSAALFRLYGITSRVQKEKNGQGTLYYILCIYKSENLAKLRQL